MHKPDLPIAAIVDQPPAYNPLRSKAEAHLHAGTSPATRDGAMGIDALRLLHRLSSDPDHAADALKLLHELQVHQVELDLQHEEIAAHERAVVEDLRRYQALYDGAPVGYLRVDFEGRVIQANATAAELFGVAREQLEGQPVDTLVSPPQRPALQGLRDRVTSSGRRESCLATAAGAGPQRPLQFLAAIAAERDCLLLACCPAPIWSNLD